MFERYSHWFGKRAEVKVQTEGKRERERERERERDGEKLYSRLRCNNPLFWMLKSELMLYVLEPASLPLPPGALIPPPPLVLRDSTILVMVMRGDC